MMRQRVRTNPVTKQIETYYEDLGKSQAVVGHGRPMLSFQTNGSVDGRSSSQRMTHGGMQLRLGGQD